MPMIRHDTTYIVYLYQYREMPRPAIGAVRRTYHNGRDLDSLPPTVIRWANVAAGTLSDLPGLLRGG